MIHIKLIGKYIDVKNWEVFQCKLHNLLSSSFAVICHFKTNIISHVLDIIDDNLFLLNNDYGFVGTIVDDDGIIDEFGSS